MERDDRSVVIINNHKLEPLSQKMNKQYLLSRSEATKTAKDSVSVVASWLHNIIDLDATMTPLEEELVLSGLSEQEAYEKSAKIFVKQLPLSPKVKDALKLFCQSDLMIQLNKSKDSFFSSYHKEKNEQNEIQKIVTRTVARFACIADLLKEATAN